MMIFEKALENAEAIRRPGVPVHHMDPALGEGIIREMPDGSRHRIRRVGGETVVVESFGPRD